MSLVDFVQAYNIDPMVSFILIFMWFHLRHRINRLDDAHAKLRSRVNDINRDP